MSTNERKILTAIELSHMFQDQKFARWANDLDDRAERYAEAEKRKPSRPAGNAPRQEYGYNR